MEANERREIEERQSDDQKEKEKEKKTVKKKLNDSSRCYRVEVDCDR